MRIDLSRSRTAMTEVLLNHAKIHSRFQQVRRVGVPQRVDVGVLGNAAVSDRIFEGGLNGRIANWTVRRKDLAAVVQWCWKQPRRRSVCLPELPQHLKRRLRQGD